MDGSREDEGPVFEKYDREVQMGGPSDVDGADEVVVWSPQYALEQKSMNANQIHPSVDGMDKHDLALVSYDIKDERKMKSLQLGMCDHPYCTTCPTCYGRKWNQRYSGATFVNLTKEPKMVLYSMLLLLCILNSLKPFVFG